ncbi:MAG: hypothetical protein P1Q69_00565 [Candidatus Thorarchaeota archaeon]|nr:hypothetical protein [Candidatus Thorarchaeota archaeon]
MKFLQATLKHVKIKMPTPRSITKDEMLSLHAPVMIFCQSNDILYPAEKVISQASEIFQDLVDIECLDGVHSPTREQFDYITDRVSVFFKAQYD